MMREAHHATCNLNVAIVEYIRQRGIAQYGDLFAQFGAALEPADPKLAHTRFRKKLEYLCYNDKLAAGLQRGTRRVYSLGHLASDTPPDRPRKDRTPTRDGEERSDAATEAPSPQRTPPCTYTGLSGQFVYRMAAPMRPGSMDHTRFASHGVRC